MILNRVNAIVKNALILVPLVSVISCGVQQSGQKSDARILEVTYNRSDLLGRNRFHLITPTGEKVLASALQWQKGQEHEANSYAQPAQCANNLSRVFENAGIYGYSSPLLSDMVEAVRARGGLVITLPKSKAGIAQSFASIFGGKIPVGSFVSGCLNADCSGEAGDGHIAMVGDIDSAGQIKIYHNNWYRPDNAGGAWKPHMIPLAWYNAGFKRKWMPTPWIYINRNASTQIPESVQVPLPAIDDLDPTNYFVTVTIPVEILNEVKQNKGVMTDGKGKVTTFKFR